jgi:hypothetical protein
MKKENSGVGRAVFAGAVKAQKYHAIDVNAVATTAGVKRADIIEALNKLNQQGHIKLTTTGVQQCYIIQKRLPQSESEIKEILDKLYPELLKRESDAVKRGKEVMGLITGKQCFALSLAQHFGMGLPDGKSKCGHCTFCAGGGAPVMPPHRPLSETTAASIKQVLATISVRDDPRFLARVAFGIRSPRISQLKLEKTNVFRSLAHHDFDVSTDPVKPAAMRVKADSFDLLGIAQRVFQGLQINFRLLQSASTEGRSFQMLRYPRECLDVLVAV